MKKRVYIAGPISGQPEYVTASRFEEAERLLIEHGYEPVNPLKLHNELKTWEGYMVTDIAALMECDAIFLMEGWHNSRGARIEFCIATEMGKKCFSNNRQKALIYRSATTQIGWEIIASN